MSKSGNTGTGRKILKVLGIVLGCIVGLILIASILLTTLLEPYAERFLKKQIAETTDGLYNLEIDGIRVNLLSGTFALQNVHIYPDTTVHNQQREAGTATPNLVELKSPLFEVSGINVYGLLFSDHIGIGNILLQSPAITMLWDERVEEAQEKEEEEKKDTKEEEEEENGLADFMETLRIGKIDIPDGSYRHQVLGKPDKVRHDLPHFSFEVHNLQVDSLDQPDHTRMFNADDIKVRIEDYQYNSPDSGYNISAGLFTYSTKTNELRAEKLLIDADNLIKKKPEPDEPVQAVYNIDAALFRITGLDVVEAYRTQELKIDQILLENAVMDVMTAEADLEALYESMSAILKVITINEFRIANSSLVLQNPADDVFIKHEIAHGTVSIQGIRIDSATLFTPKQNMPVQNLVANLEGYTLTLPTSPHTLKAGRINFSTVDNFLHADSLKIDGDWSKNQKLKQSGKAAPSIYDIAVAKIRIDEFNPFHTLQTTHLNIGSIHIAQPDIVLTTDKQQQKKQPASDAGMQQNMQQTYQEYSDIISKVIIGRINISNASLLHQERGRTTRKIQKLEQGSLLTTGVHIDSAFVFRKTPGLPVDDVKIQATNYTYHMPDNSYTYKLGNIKYSTKSQELLARSIEAIPSIRANELLDKVDKGSRNLFELTAGKFRVTGLDVVEALNTGILAIDQVILSQPELAILQDRNIQKTQTDANPEDALDDIFEIVNPITVNSIRLEDGRFTYHERRVGTIRTHVLEHASAQVVGLHLTPAKMQNLEESLPIDDLVLAAKDYNYRSPDDMYVIKLDELNYSTKKQLLTASTFTVKSNLEKNERLKREAPERASHNLFNVSANEFRVTGLDILHAHTTGRFHLKEIILTKPDVAILQDKNVPANGQPGEEESNGMSEEQMEQISEIVDAFSVQTIRIDDGTFHWAIKQDTLTSSQTLEHVALRLEGLRLVSLDEPDPLDMFDLEDMALHLDSYTYVLPDSLYVLEVGEVNASSKERSFYIDNLRLIPLFNIDEYPDRLKYAEDRLDIQIPAIRLNGVNYRALFNRQDFIANHVLIKDPVLDIYRDDRVEPDPDRRPVTFQNMLRRLEYYVRVNTLKVEGGELTYSSVPVDGEEPAVLVMKKLVIEIDNITNDSVFITRNNFITANASAKLMGESLMRLAMKLQLDHPEDFYTYSGSLETMNFEALNPLFEHMMNVRLHGGQINRADFKVNATEHIAEGQLNFYYNDLNIKLVNADDPGNPTFWQRKANWAINTFVIKSHNPARNGRFREGEIEVERDYTKSVFNHMGASMLDGMTASLMSPFVRRIVDMFVGT